MHLSAALEEYLVELAGGEYDAFVQACDKPCAETFRVNTLKALVEDAFDFQGERIPWCPTGYRSTKPVGDTIEHFQGLVYVQEAVSMIPAEVLAPSADDVVLDISAAPGSKTTQMAALMGNRGCIVANDVDAKRVKTLRFNLNRMGVVNSIVTNMDGARFRPNMTFDKILLDAPCSNLGQLRDNPEAGSTWSRDKVDRCAQLQKRLLDTAAELLREGGVLVYSTCTFSPEENEEVVEYAIEEHNLKAEKVEWGFNCHPGLASWRGRDYQPTVKRTARVYPQDNDTGGFYVARLRK
jgi:tRNA (cytosine49-C5)-methyltransferase